MINYLQSEFPLTQEKVEDCKEVFMLFDRDEDGVLSFQELQVVMKSMGERPSGKLSQLSYKLSLTGPQVNCHSCHKSCH